VNPLSEAKVRSGIIGLDELIEGGLPRGFSYAIVGGPGSGKTTFGAQFLFKGASLYGENGIYVTFEEPPHSIANNMMRFDWNFYDLESRGKIALVDASPIRSQTPSKYAVRGGPLGSEKFSIDGVLGVVMEARRNVNARRCVIDSISSLMLQFKDDFEMRHQVLTMIKALTEMGLTTLLMTERTEERMDVQRFGIAEFLCQGVILLHTYRFGDSMARVLEIRKMRGVKHSEKLCLFRITPEGIQVYPQETVFASK
jgi:KaiC/GvpD/RAD55 family RecA-like ATPase